MIEVWESEEDARGFLKEGLLPAPEVVGVPAPLQPELWPVQPHVGAPHRGGGRLYPDAGHLPWLEEPARVGGGIAHFLSTKQRSGEEAVA